MLSNILNLVAPEKVDVKPDPAPEPKKPDPAPEPKKPDPEPAKTEPAAPEPKKLPVKKRDAAPTLSAEEIRRIAAEEAAKAAPKPAEPAVKPEPAKPDDSSLTEAEKEELALAELAEKKDPNRKGLTDQFRSFYKKQAEFLEGRMAAEGEDYDPASDPEYKKWASRNSPKLTAAERKALREEQIAEAAAARALKEAEQKFKPEIERLSQKARELEHKPAIRSRVDTYTGEVAAGMPEEIVKFFNDNGRDLKKTQEAFPGEFEIVAQLVSGASALAEEALSLRRGITRFDPTNSKHQYLDQFLVKQADSLLARPAEERTRDGKTFVHPHKWSPDLADRHWTFDDEDVLGMLKSAAQKEAKERVSARRAELKAAIEAHTRRTAAPTGAAAAPAPAPAPTPSTRTPAGVTPGAAVSAGKGSSRLSSLLNLG